MVNGVEVTSFSTETNFSQNDSTMHNANSSYMESGSLLLVEDPNMILWLYLRISYIDGSCN